MGVDGSSSINSWSEELGLDEAVRTLKSLETGHPIRVRITRKGFQKQEVLRDGSKNACSYLEDMLNADAATSLPLLTTFLMEGSGAFGGNTPETPSEASSFTSIPLESLLGE